jgi:hypothetical protein
MNPHERGLMKFLKKQKMSFANMQICLLTTISIPSPAVRRLSLRNGVLYKPTYRYSNEGEIIRERGLDEVRFTVSDKAFEQLIKLLEKLKDVDESELT